MITTETKYSINFARSNRNISLSLHYNESNSFLFVNTTKISIQRKKYEAKSYISCLRNISKDFTANNMKKNRIKWILVRLVMLSIFINVFRKKNICIYKIIFGFIKIMFIRLLASIVNASY